mmetsp:Transcript_168416/g.323655  ORF Transcript_168416/g.323655 Transcript_168416/m.323655 type:complete len:234 (+) Transcript_168416:91-792(+)
MDMPGSRPRATVELVSPQLVQRLLTDITRTEVMALPPYAEVASQSRSRSLLYRGRESSRRRSTQAPAGVTALTTEVQHRGLPRRHWHQAIGCTSVAQSPSSLFTSLTRGVHQTGDCPGRAALRRAPRQRVLTCQTCHQLRAHGQMTGCQRFRTKRCIQINFASCPARHKLLTAFAAHRGTHWQGREVMPSRLRCGRPGNPRPRLKDLPLRLRGRPAEGGVSLQHLLQAWRADE